MLKKLGLSLLSALVLTNVSLAQETENVKIVSIEESPISRLDVAKISSEWADTNIAVYMYMMNSYSQKASDYILSSLPELKNNKVALASITMALVMLSEQSDLDIEEGIRHLYTHKYIVNMTKISWEEAVSALTTYSI